MTVKKRTEYSTALCPNCKGHKWFIDRKFVVCTSCMFHFGISGVKAEDLVDKITTFVGLDKEGELL